MKRKLLFSVCIGIILICTTSCFDIIEKIHFNKSKGGKASFTIDASKSKVQIDFFLKLQEYSQSPDATKFSTNNIKKQIAEVQRSLDSIPDISNVEVSIDYDKYIGFVTFDFENIAALNRIMSKGQTSLVNHILYTDKQFKQENISVNEVKSFFSSFNYTEIPKLSVEYIFDGKKVASVSNNKSVISNNNEVSIEVSIPDLIEEKVSIENIVIF